MESSRVDTIVMQPFKKVTGLVVPLDRVNVDTDQIVPKQFLKLVERTGFGKYLFYDWRFEPDGKMKADFVLNQPRYQRAKILLARANFGSGSSREHAVWGIDDYGFRALIAPSFADIFYNNCFKNGLLPVKLPADQVDVLFTKAYAQEGYKLTVDLESQRVTDDEGMNFAFEIDQFRKKSLLEGLDDIRLTLEYEDLIKAYEERKSHILPSIS